ncbi:hypothetical protein AN964_20605 [Heyndrickxia shackletonii]|uniref:Anti-sigma-F factor Fin family protein n=1 Tax=Heyndrickxia shackletonii TaxID=157838 RepID=A0A0Q3WTE9_9BACI|nr:anti-sigma-F factor Fin family protein [Heyndrickxia shackletonii]KQL51378.1 hypothetical protein AN964_20605 [Heyndrickxia shackletonii]MBB2481436.1 anti-sigma-F factor Fin family protein [Bacillus sp. APMAM]NEZ01935.1 anti-sigma-F factor Fin family protein [Heyndrickxia shackletonii]RTZ55207.1 anti-sigma-F factor Fin family protein [Bacillus sp. SAJ1]
MAIHYFCRHCGTNMGILDNLSIHADHLGLNTLTNEERQDMISYESNGNIHIKSICEDCQEALTSNPELHAYDYLIH